MNKNGRVTLRDVYHIADKIDQKLDKIDEKHAERLEAVAKRVSALELWRAEFMGRVTVLVGVASLVFTGAWEFIKSKLGK